MDLQQNDFLNPIFLKIEDLFADEIGPVASILCEEVKAEWISDLCNKGQRPGFRNIPIYVQKLSKLIEDEHNKKTFLDAVFEIDALNLFNKP